MRVKIDYDGRYPNLCSGNLVVTISGSEIERANKKWYFPRGCLVSGGNVYFDKHWSEVVEEGAWYINDYPQDFPEELKAAVLDAVNEEVAWGCCGGCV